MKLILTLSVVIVACLSCQDRVTYRVLPKFRKAVLPEVSSTIQVVTDDRGQIRADELAEATKFRARLLDASCGEEIYNLGIQDKPEFSLPINAYSQPLCLETTYMDASDRILKVKLQPFSFEGPPPVNVTLDYDKQIIDFQDIPHATTYAYIVLTKDGKPNGFDSDLKESVIDFRGSLTEGNYRMLLMAQGTGGQNVRVITYLIKVLAGTHPVATSFDMRFEREFYQTRSIKRILIDQTLMSDIAGLKVAGVSVELLRYPTYMGGYGAFLDSSDAFMRSSVLYGGSKLSVLAQGLSETPKDLAIVVRDFTYFASTPTAFANGSYELSGLEAWASTLQQNTVQSADTSLTTGFGMMILK
ncbi:MAG: hypothetical protein H7318_10730 [Oligoflexus sp.]|nr:hypothetical protein [Oligoflexus sp.]